MELPEDLERRDCMQQGRTGGLALPVSLFLLTALTRIPFSSKLLYHWDSAQFGLAVNLYDIRGHQPHPPGYFLYVMLGRLAHTLITDINSSYISLGILFSCLSVLLVYFLAERIFDRKTGAISSLLLITSPNFWFHGEVALTYAPEAFFSALVAFLCWKVYKGEHKYIWLSALALGLSGGIRQNSVLFLFPLWVFSIRKAAFIKRALAMTVLCAVCISWFVPMVAMTGGWGEYKDAINEYTRFVIGHETVFNLGGAQFGVFFGYFCQALYYGTGAGMLVLAYAVLRSRSSILPERPDIFFFLFWLMPSVLFFLLVHMSAANPGYVLILMPGLSILMAASAVSLAGDLRKATNRDLLPLILSILVIFNLYIFFISKGATSYSEIREHDRDLSIVLSSVKALDPGDTAVFADCSLTGSRHIMFYAPEFRTYSVDIRQSEDGVLRDTFWGQGGRTSLSREIVLPEYINRFGALVESADEKVPSPIEGITFTKLLPSVYMAAGPIELMSEVYPAYKENYAVSRNKRHYVPLR